MRLNRHTLELYKCAMLTIIAVALVFIGTRTPVPYTVQNVQSHRVEPAELPLVRVYGGHLSADVSVDQ